MWYKHEYHKRQVYRLPEGASKTTSGPWTALRKHPKGIRQGSFLFRLS